MPICLPDPDFQDEDILATAVGMGLKSELLTCKTDANGPEVKLIERTKNLVFFWWSNH